MGYVIGAVVVYFLFFSGRSTQLTSTARAAQPTIATNPGATTITVPGLGSYTNVGGGQAVGITIDGNLIGSLFG